MEDLEYHYGQRVNLEQRAAEDERPYQEDPERLGNSIGISRGLA